MSDNQKWEIIQGDALKVLSGFAPGTFDAVITDPPYASGGRTQAEKNKSTAKKYSSMGENAPPPFDGDAKDQRSWTRWAAEWLYEARKVCKPGAPVCMFIDWRQLPAATDALQWAAYSIHNGIPGQIGSILEFVVIALPKFFHISVAQQLDKDIFCFRQQLDRSALSSRCI